MDPISIVSLVDASIDLTLKCASAVKKLNDIVAKYKNAKLSIMSMIQNLDAMQVAWQRIGAWWVVYRPLENADEDQFTQRMTRFLETGTLVLDALDDKLRILLNADGDIKLPQRARLIWSGSSLQRHQNSIRDQATSMTLLLQAISLQVAFNVPKIQMFPAERS